MESVAALGVAAAAVQFFGIVVKATVLCRQIRDNADSATDYNKSLEASVRELRDVRGQLSNAARPPPGQSPSSSRRVVEWVTKCQQDSDDLIKLLEEMRGAGRNTNTARNLFRAIKDRRKIEKLEKSLQSKKEGLHEVLQHDTLRIAENQESRLQETLARLQEILAKLAQINLNVGEAVKESTANINLATGEAIKTSTQSIAKRLDQTDSKARTQFVRAERLASKRHRQVVMQAQSHHEDLNAKANAQKFLESLFFSEILDRQNHIQDAGSGTLEWIFETEDLDITDEAETSAAQKDTTDQKEVLRQSASGRKWDDLAAWLRNDNGVYWVNGKAGSGKSTLMSHIVQDPRTRKALNVWCKGRTCHTLSYFFWRPGTTMQKSIMGLLRSLLYQVCSGKPQRINALMRRLDIEPSMIHMWSEKRLKRAFHEVVTIAIGSRFCVFVDGLDEFDGNYVELVDLIFELQNYENVKFCVSSRPETQLKNTLSSCKTLRLQDLNFPDIVRYIRLKLPDVQLDRISRPKGLRHWHKDLGSLLAERAEGVFLWAALVTTSLAQGVAAGDDKDTLLERIESTPQDLNKLFKSMLARIDRVHLKPLAFYLKALSLFGKHIDLISIATLTASRAPDAVCCLTDFEVACKQTETQVISQSAGLLEIREDPRPLFTEMYWDPMHVWLKCKSTTSLARERQTCTVEYPATLIYESKILAWVHRSAYDFVSDPEMAKYLHMSQNTSDEILRQLLAGSLAFLHFAPSSFNTDSKDSRTEFRLYNLLKSIEDSWLSHTSVTHEAIGNLHSTVSAMDCGEFISALDHYGNVDAFPPDWALWHHCVYGRHWKIVLDNSDRLPVVIWGTFIKLASASHALRNAYAAKLLQIIQRKILGILVHPPSAGNIRIAWSGHPLAISYNRWPGQQDSPASYAAEKQLVTDIATLVCRSISGLGRVPKNFWHDITIRSGLFIEIARASPRLYMQAFGLGFCNAAHSVSTTEHGYIPCNLQPGSVRFICFPWRETSKDSGGLALETERFLHFETGQNTIETISRCLLYNVHPRYIHVVFEANIEEFRSVHKLIIDGLQANKQHLSTDEQHLVLRCLQTHLRDLLMSIWVNTDPRIKEYDFSSELTDAERESMSHGSEGHRSEGPDIQLSETIQPLEAGEDDGSSDWVTDDGGSSSSDEEVA